MSVEPHPAARTARFDASFAANFADVARYCARRCRSAEDAEDAAVEVFAVAWRRVDDLPRSPDDRLWLLGVARRVLANVERGQRRRDRLVALLQAQPAPVLLREPSDPRAALLAGALRALSDSDRELLLLAGWEELTPGQIAAVLGRPAPLVSRRLYRARRRLAEQLDRSDEAPQRPSPIPRTQLEGIDHD